VFGKVTMAGVKSAAALAGMAGPSAGRFQVDDVLIAALLSARKHDS
jgi:hypothetical protein